MNHLETIRKYYSNTLTFESATNKLVDFIEEKYHIKPNQIVYADSLGYDFANTIQYPSNAKEMLGPIHLGGLDGYPFTGLSGMRAFARHIPRDGAAVIFYAPHIGISKDGKMGEINPYGKNNSSACHVAAQGGLSKLIKDELKKGDITESDYQMNIIEQILLKSKDRILKANNQIFEATEVIYEAIDSQIDFLISKTNYTCKHLFQIGGVFIRGDFDKESSCSFKRLEHINLENGLRTNLMEDFFKE